MTRVDDMPEKIQNILEQYVSGVKDIYGTHLKYVLLYGSYARGDYHEGSDIDIMILVDLSNDEIRTLSGRLSDMTFDINYDHETMIMPMVQNLDFFNKWVRAHPFYNNVNNEGVELYAAA